MRILVVDDDEILVEVLSRSLGDRRHVVDVAEDGRLGWEYVQSGEYELILLDIDLPEMDGVSLCEKMRSQGYTTPILLMTAKDASQERIRGLDAGADDYLTKPLDLEELNARIRALSRRGEVIPTAVLDVNGLRLDPSSCQVSYLERPIKLTAKEYCLLELFLRNPARVFSRSQILDRIWTFDDPPLEESVKAHIKGLRKKLKKAGIVDWIENVYGIGYRLNPSVARSQEGGKATPKASVAEKVAGLENPQPVSSSIETEFNQQMEQMWLQYQNKMAERLQLLRTAAAKIQEEHCLAADIQKEAERAAHKLAGVLGMFARDTGTTIAREIETLLGTNSVFDPQLQAEFISLVADLDSLLALNENLVSDSVSAPKLLLISADPRLGKELQQLGRGMEMGWHQVAKFDRAKAWLQTNSPYLVAIDTEIVELQAEALSLITELTARTPTVPTLVISATDQLRDRLKVARAGASGFLVKPFTAELVWQTSERLLEKQRAAIASILIVDDDPIFLASLRSLLQPWGMRVTTLENPSRFWEVLPKTHPDLLILDVEMPQINGLELCQTLRSDPEWQELPTLFLTAHREAETVRQVFDVGADDYISKPVVGAELIARINNRLDRSRLLHTLATQDPLTGLKNRSQGSRELETCLQQAKNSQDNFSLVVISMSELRQINLKYGHSVGDRILAQWGKVIRAAFRGNEVVSYWSNGDFVIGIPHLNQTEVGEQLAEVLTILRKQIFTSLKGDRFQVACNASVAQFPSNGDTIHSLYRACYSSQS